jgi:DNA-binding transcriptional LysR family regulator
MRINQIHAFLAVAESESFSLAAEQLHITQPAVSKRIRQLEDSLKTSLFDRIGKRSLLTPDGLAFKPHAERMLYEVKAFKADMSHRNNRPAGTLTLATSHHIGLHRLPQVLRDFKIEFPDIDLDLHFMDSEDACIAIANNDLELAVVTLPEHPDENLALEPVWIDKLVVVMAIDHELASMHPIEPAQLLKHPAILPSAGTFTRKIINSYFSTKKDSMKVALETNYLETIKVMVAANLGWSVLPVSMVDKTLLGRNLKGLDIARPLGIVTHKHRTLSLNSKAMIAMLRREQDT